MSNEFMGAHWPRTGFLRTRDADDLKSSLVTILNGELGSVSTEQFFGSDQRRTIDELAERVISSEALDEVRRDESVSLRDLERLVVGCALAIKESVRNETRAVPVEHDDQLSPDTPRSALNRIESRLRSTAESLRTGVFDGMELGPDLTDLHCARRLDEIARKVSGRIRYRESREAVRSARSSGEAGAPLKPETYLAVAVDQALENRRPAERRSVASQLIQDVLEVSISPEKIRTRLNDFYRRNPR